MIRDEKLSAALFAPGWVMEEHGSEHFTVNNDKRLRDLGADIERI